MGRIFPRAGCGAAAVAALCLMTSGCGRSEPTSAAGNNVQAAVVAPGNSAAAQPQQEASMPTAKVDQGGSETSAEPVMRGEEDEERRGPSRQARCRVDDEPERACTFTPVFGDGSFDIEMPDRQLRLIVSGDEAAPFELIGSRRIPIVGLLRRDPQDRACWISGDADAVLKRVCAR